MGRRTSSEVCRGAIRLREYYFPANFSPASKISSASKPGPRRWLCLKFEPETNKQRLEMFNRVFAANIKRECSPLESIETAVREGLGTSFAESLLL